jgi:hypothetical protein
VLSFRVRVEYPKRCFPFGRGGLGQFRPRAPFSRNGGSSQDLGIESGYADWCGSSIIFMEGQTRQGKVLIFDSRTSTSSILPESNAI